MTSFGIAFIFFTSIAKGYEIILSENHARKIAATVTAKNVNDRVGFMNGLKLHLLLNSICGVQIDRDHQLEGMS